MSDGGECAVTSCSMRVIPEALVGRDAELAELAALLDRTRQGDGGVAFFEGPVGIGKTALLDAGAAMASGLRVLRGRGGEVERDLSFGLVRDLFEPLLRSASASDRRRWLSGAASDASAVLGESREGAADPASVAYGLYWLLAAIAERQPVLLVADDLQWCDASSLRWLVYLARRIDGLPVGLLAASRQVDLDESVLVGQLAAIRGVSVRRPEPLDVAATRELIVRKWSSASAPAFVHACLAVSGGNPLLLRELLDTAHEEGLTPDGPSARRINNLTGERLRRAVLSRLGRVEPSAALLARAVAVLGDGCELRFACELAGIERASAVAALPALVAIGVLADSQPLSFEHPLVRTVVYFDIPAPVRAAEHRRAAAVLSAADAGPEAVAHHLLSAEPVGEAWAQTALSEAGRKALARGAPESAVAYLRRALDERPDVPARAELLRDLGNALVRLGDPAALGVLEQALTLAASPAARVQIVTESVDPLLGAGRAAEARSLLLGTLDDAKATGPELAILASAQLAVVLALGGVGEDESIAELRGMASRLDATTAARRYAAGALALLGAVRDGKATNVSELARLAVGNEATVEADARAGRPLHIARVALALAGEPQAALRGFEEALDVSRARGSLMGQGIALGWRSLIHMLAGNVVDAENDGRAALAVLEDTGLSGPVSGAVCAIAWALIERGELDEAHELLEAAPPGVGWGGVALGCARAQLLIARHRYAEALELSLAVGAEAERGGWRAAGPLPWRSLVAAAQFGVGNLAAARQLAVDDLAAAELFGVAREVGRAMRVLGLVEEGSDGLSRLRAAVECLGDAGARLEFARALIDYGAALRRSGERVSARPPLYEGLELAHACGALTLEERARTELRAAGARPRRVARSGVDALTPSEARVTKLAAAGLTNAEIAQTLFVTVRTVEMHLSAAYRKLRIASRDALPSVLAGAVDGS